MTLRFIATSCPHCPEQDKEAVAWYHKKVEEYRPDLIIHLGDGHEATAASKFDIGEEGDDLPVEFASHNEFLFETRKAATRSKSQKQKPRFVFLPGNHDDNIMAPGRISKRVRGLCDYRLHESEFADGHWEHHGRYVYERKRGTFKVGPVTFAHGFECGVSSDEFQAILLGMPYGLFVSGHTHRPTQNVTRAMKTKGVPLPWWFANPGCLRDMKPTYMNRKRTVMWGQGIVVGEADETIQSPRLKRDGWDAHVEIFRMRDDV